MTTLKHTPPTFYAKRTDGELDKTLIMGEKLCEL